MLNAVAEEVTLILPLVADAIAKVATVPSLPVVLFKNDWNLNQILEDNPSLKLNNVAPVVSGVEPINL